MNKTYNVFLLDRNSDKGVVLILILWTITIMLSIILSFSFMSRTEALATFSFAETIKRDFLAEAGITRAIMETIYAEEYAEDALVDYEELWRADGSVHEGKLPSGKYKVMINHESGKINLNDNQAVRFVLKNLLLEKKIGEEEVDTIIDSILDWRDNDDLHRMNGAETDYYKSLEPPYRAKNANFEIIEELLLVKGITKELFYGSEEKGRGLNDLVTVYSETGLININYAPEEVLRAIPDISDETVDEILTKRQEEKIEGDIDIGGGIDGRYATDETDKKIYTIQAVGYTESGLSRYGIRAVVQIEDMVYTYKYWKNQSLIDIHEEDEDEGI
jgi:general secretion pathway protein K